MPSMRPMLFVITTIISIQFMIGQGEDTLTKFKLSIAQAPDNTYTQSQPASMIATFPRDSSRSTHSIDGYLGLSWHYPDNTKNEFMYGINIEKHKNTLISKKQDVTQYGILVGNVFLRKGESGDYMLNSNLSIKHSEDKIKEKKGLQYLLYFNLALKNPRDMAFWRGLTTNEFTFPNNERELEVKTDSKFFLSDFIQYRSSHALGIEYIGYEKLPLFSLAYNIELYPFSGLLYQVFKHYQLLRIDLGVVHRSKISSANTDLFTGNLIKASFGFNLFFDEERKQSIGIGYSYQEGGDPLKGLDDTIFSQISLKAIIGLK